MLPENLQLIELTAYANQTKLFSMNCNNNDNDSDSDNDNANDYAKRQITHSKAPHNALLKS